MPRLCLKTLGGCLPAGVCAAAGIACLLLGQAGCRNLTTPTTGKPTDLVSTLDLDQIELEPPDKRLVPSNDRDWRPDQSVLSYAEFVGDAVNVYNIRNCTYRTAEDYDVDWYDRTFHLNDLQTVDLIVVPFAGVPTLAHTMLSFGFGSGDYVCVSVEIRKEAGESYEPLTGSLNQFEIMYVVGDERDLIKLRTNHRLDDVFVYRTKATPEQARALFEDVMRRVNKLYHEPEFYNTLTNNCTTNIARHVNRLWPNRVPLDYRVLLPGLSGHLAYDLGLLETETSFEQTRLQARVNDRAFAYRDDPDFSEKIRR